MIVAVPKTDKCSSDEIKRRTQLPWLQIRKWLSLDYFDGYLEPRTTWLRGLVFLFVINYFISETTSYNIYKHNTFYHAQVLSSHTVK